MRVPSSVVAIAVAASFIACQKPKPQAAAEIYTPVQGAVGLDLLKLGNSGGPQRWLVTYADAARLTKFQIEFGSTQNEGAAAEFGHGKFLPDTNSDPTPLLDALTQALQAKRMPRSAERADTLLFDFVVPGEALSRSSDGGFTENPPGNWTSTKIILVDNQAEVYFNYNPAIHKAEFSIKDPDYGDRVLAELAKVF